MPSRPPRTPSPFRNRAQWVTVTFTVIAALIPTMLLGGWNWIVGQFQGPAEVKVYAVQSDACFPHYYDSLAEAKRTAARQDGAGVSDGKHQPVDLGLTLQTESARAIVITGIKVKVLSRKPLPTSGVVVEPSDCGGIVEPRYFSVDLTRPPVSARPVTGPAGEKSVRLPLKVSQSDPEQLELQFHPGDRDIRLSVEIDWVSAGEPGSKTFDNGGPGYRVMGTPHVPRRTLAEVVR